jgi:hypothetical protein
LTGESELNEQPAAQAVPKPSEEIASNPVTLGPKRRPVLTGSAAEVASKLDRAPLIPSGVHCNGCGIGVEVHWRACPVCGSGLA